MSSPVVTLGFGSFGSIGLVVTLGFGGVAVVPEEDFVAGEFTLLVAANIEPTLRSCGTRAITTNPMGERRLKAAGNSILLSQEQVY